MGGALQVEAIARSLGEGPDATQATLRAMVGPRRTLCWRRDRQRGAGVGVGDAGVAEPNPLAPGDVGYAVIPHYAGWIRLRRYGLARLAHNVLVWDGDSMGGARVANYTAAFPTYASISKGQGSWNGTSA